MKIPLKYFNIDYLIVFLLLLTGGSVPFVFFRNPITLFLLGIILLFLFLNKNNISRKIFNAGISSIVFVLIFLTINFFFASSGQSLVKFGYLFISFLIPILLIIYIDTRRISFLYILKFILQIIMIHSLINFFVFPLIKNNLVEITYEFNNYTCYTYKYIFYYMPERYGLLLGDLFCRNQGLFWEPGVLQIFLNILFFIDAFLLNNKSKINLFFVGLALIATWSSTGILILAFQLVVYFWKQIRKNVLLLPIILVFSVFFYNLIQSNVEEKIHGDERVSSQVRLFDIAQQSLIIADNPILGIGLDDQKYKEKRLNYEINIQEIDYESLEKGSTNSLFFLMAAAGIPITFFMIYCLFFQNIFSNNKLLFVCIFIFSIMSEPVLLKPFFLLFVMSGFMVICKRFLW